MNIGIRIRKKIRKKFLYQSGDTDIQDTRTLGNPTAVFTSRQLVMGLGACECCTWEGIILMTSLYMTFDTFYWWESCTSILSSKFRETTGDSMYNLETNYMLHSWTLISWFWGVFLVRVLLTCFYISLLSPRIWHFYWISSLCRTVCKLAISSTG